MYCSTFVARLRLLAKCLTGRPVTSLPSPPLTPSLPSSLVDRILKSAPSSTDESASVNKATQVEIIAGKVEGTRHGDVAKTEVECRLHGSVLEARIRKDLELVAAKNPLLRSLTHKIIANEAENGVDEIMTHVQNMFDELYSTKHEGGIDTANVQVPYDEKGAERGRSKSMESIRLGRYTWLDATKEGEFAGRIARCEMTIEDVDELLCDLHQEMNDLVLRHSDKSEKRRSMARQVRETIKEYAEILLNSPCEVRLAVERARVRTVGLRRSWGGDTAYLDSLAPGSSHVVGCDRRCIRSYLPRRHQVAKDRFQGPGLSDEPELSVDNDSGASTPNEVPNTPRPSIIELSEHPLAIAIQEEKPPVGAVEENVAPIPLRKTKVACVSRTRPAWR